MTYTKQVQEYCQNNQGTVLDVSLMKDSEFSEIPYKTLLKILNRLEKEKLLLVGIKPFFCKLFRLFFRPVITKNHSHKSVGDFLPFLNEFNPTTLCFGSRRRVAADKPC